MRDEFYTLIRPIVQRLKINRSLRLASLTSLVGLSICVGFAASVVTVIFATIAIPIALGAVLFFLKSNDSHQAADSIDRCFSLKNRVCSTHEILQQEAELSAISELQVRDTIHRLKECQISDAVPISRSKVLTFTSCLLLGVSFSLWLPYVHSASLRDNSHSKPVHLENLLKDLPKPVESIESILDAKIDNTEKLRVLSNLKLRMEKENQNSVLKTNSQEWEQIAKALEAIPSTQSISNDIRSKDFQSVARKLEKLDFDSMKEIERKTIEDNFRRVSRAGDSEIKKRLSDISLSMQNKSKTLFDSAMKGLAQLANQHDDLLQNQQQVVKELAQIDLAKQAISNSSIGKNLENSSQKELFRASQIAFELEKNGETTNSKSDSDSNPSIAKKDQNELPGELVEFKREMEKVINKKEIPPAYRKTVKNYFEELQKLSAEKRKRSQRE